MWDYDTAAAIVTVNAGVTKGGTLDGSGQVIVNGLPYTNSGYARLIGYPGNLLLAFSVNGK